MPLNSQLILKLYFIPGKFHRQLQQLNAEVDVHVKVRHQLHRVESPAWIVAQS
jgi:hypothetical protein